MYMGTTLFYAHHTHLLFFQDRKYDGGLKDHRRLQLNTNGKQADLPVKVGAESACMIEIYNLIECPQMCLH